MFADTIKKLRIKNYMNQTAFANVIGVTQGTVSQWEHGLTRPNSDQLKAISTKFNISIDDLLYEEPAKEQQHDSIPKTAEARILSKGVDQLPKEQREQALAMFRVMFAPQYAQLFTKGIDDDDT